MAKKHGKNIQKLLKKKQLHELQANPTATALPTAAVANEPLLPQPIELPALPSGDNKAVIRTITSVVIATIILVGVTISSRSTHYLDTFGNWLYLTLQLG